MAMRGGLDLARPRHGRRVRRVLLALALCAALAAALPRLAAAVPAGLGRLYAAVGDWCAPHYTARLEELQRQNAALHARLAQAGDALAENEALRALTGSARAEGAWQPAAVTARFADGVTLACAGAEGAAVLDAQGRYAGRVVRDNGNDTCDVAFAGSAQSPCAGLAGGHAGLLERGAAWQLTGLPADCALGPGTPVTAPGGYWLGTLAEAPAPEADGLTARAALTDTAALDSTVFFVKL